ncbi:hypothetical protein [Paenibacillus montanisoli]|uniref:hypothetical protein n=1 Tax=Paenibacillus montanisoli TaxID=2081970 RepID=UPI001057D7F2|nr:hypothetical protein [Paenibacillus montanisoli]
MRIIENACFRRFIPTARISNRFRYAFPWRDKLRIIALLVVPLQRFIDEVSVKLHKERAIPCGQLRRVIVVVGVMPLQMLLQQRCGKIRNYRHTCPSYTNVYFQLVYAAA